MATDLIAVVAQLSEEETAEMAKLCLCELSDAAEIDVIVEQISGDIKFRDELIANLENINA